MVGPSPVTSNGTETTEIEDDVSEDVHRENSGQIASRRFEVSNHVDAQFILLIPLAENDAQHQSPRHPSPD